MEKLKVGIIGTGLITGIARAHTKAYELCERANLVALYDIVPGKAQIFHDKWELGDDVKVCQTLDEFYAMVDAVSVCTPNYMHVPVAIDAMEHGKHVLVEKPISTSYEEGLKLYDYSLKHPELKALVVFNYREFATTAFMKEILDSGRLGDIISVRVNYGGGRIGDPENVYLEWRMQEDMSGTGALCDFGVHMLDITDYLLHDKIGNFKAFNGMTTTLIKERYKINMNDPYMGKLDGTKAPVTNDDVAAFSAVSESGALCNYVTGRLKLKNQVIEIIGTGGAISLDTAYPAGTLGVYFADEKKTDENGKPVFPSIKPVKIPEKYNEYPYGGHNGMINEFVNCVLDNLTPKRDIRRALYIQRQVDNFAKAAKTGKTVYETVDEKEIHRD